MPVTQGSDRADGMFATVQGLSELVPGTPAQFSDRPRPRHPVGRRRTRVVAGDFIH